VDGSGSPGRPGELGVREGRIESLDASVPGAARTVIDAEGHTVCPGFIDLHTHCLASPCENFLQAGVTLVVGGNCGFSPLDMREVAAGCVGACGPNLAMLVGHNGIRIAAMGNVDRRPSPSELERMRELVARAMASGAAGLSSGLEYVPGSYAATAELVDLARAAAPYGGYYASHMRDEGRGLLDSIRETAEVGRSAGLPAQVSHIKAVGPASFGRSRDALALLDELRAGGVDIAQDQYPYTASCGRILILFPAWAQEGGVEEMRARLDDRARRARLKEALMAKLDENYGGDGERIVLSAAPPGSDLSGRSLAAVALSAGRSTAVADLAETVLDIVGRHPSQGEVFCVYHGMCEEDVTAFLSHPRTAVGSDAWVPRPEDTQPHPRMFGTCPRVLGHYSRERGLFPMEEAVRRMTSLPASRLGLEDRGTLGEGAWADLVVFDPAAVLDRATFGNPRQSPTGIDCVLVNGRTVVDHGRLTGALPGVFVPGPGLE
jgi:N-acyl-D-amino-acid deacylase